MAAPYQKKVPTALHSELTEYTSLLRTLRTNNILDVSFHLTQHGKARNSLVSVEEQGSSPELTQHEPITDTVDNKNNKNRKRQRQRQRDNWTLWPLLLTDLSKPTWTFEDEVALVASQALKLNPSSTSLPSSSEPEPNDDTQNPPAEHTERESQQNSDAEDDDLDVDDLDVRSYYKYIAMSAHDFLSDILALIALHTPLRSPSMQNRIEPLDWRSVLEIVSVYGDHSVVDEQILNQVQARIESLYELPKKLSFPEFENGESSIALRLRKNNEVERQLANDMSQAFDSLFELPPPCPIEAPKPKRPRKGVKSRAIITDSSDEGEMATGMSIDNKQARIREQHLKKTAETRDTIATDNVNLGVKEFGREA